MQLQLALDMVTLEEAKKIIGEVEDFIDIIEVGTPFVMKDGLRAVREIHETFPKLKILADLKIMDGGEYEAFSAIEAGADIITVLALADDATIASAVKTAKKYDRQIMADMICVPCIEARARQVERLGVDYICVHTAIDVQSLGRTPLKDLQAAKQAVQQARLAVAGGIKLENIADVLVENPAIIIVGGGITGQRDKRQASANMKQMIQQGKGS